MTRYLCNVAGWVVVEADNITEARRLAAIKVRPEYEKKPWLWENVEAHEATPEELERYARLVDASRPRFDASKGQKPRTDTKKRLAS